MNQLRNLLIDAIQKQINNEKEIAIFFSGGTDSLTCLFSCLELNIKPKLYTFHLEDHISEDVKVSKKIADYFKLEHKIVSIKKDKNQLVNDIKNLICTYGVYNKIRLQILYPFPYLLEHTSEKFVITGLSADTLYGTNYHSELSASNKFNQVRNQAILTDEIDGYHTLKKMVNSAEKTLVAPYRDKKVVDYFLKFSWEELNKPIQKNVSVEAFNDYFEALSVYRKSNSLILNSGIIKFHDILISSEFNKNNRKTLDEIFLDVFLNRI